MPSSDAILTGLTTAANDWRGLAIAWHVVFALLFAMLVAGWRPSVRLLSRLLVAPLVSVSVIAGLTGNPFNAVLFAIVVAVLITATVRLPGMSSRLASAASVVLGVVVVVFGWTYPHFVRTDSWTTYLFASPFGILPCPTLSVVIGITLIFSDLRARSWSMALAAAGLLYGLIGVLRLGVALDWGLLLASAVLAAAITRDALDRKSVSADRIEHSGPLPDDDPIPHPLGALAPGGRHVRHHTERLDHSWKRQSRV